MQSYRPAERKGFGPSAGPDHPFTAESKGAAVEGTLLASGLGFPEGPVVMPDGSIVLCDGNTGQLLRWADGAMGVYAETGGSPWGAILGTDRAIYVTQGGNVPGADDQSFVRASSGSTPMAASSC